MSQNPFSAMGKPAAPAAPTAVEAQASVETTTVIKTRKPPKKGADRKKPAIQLTKEDRRYILENYAQSDTSQIARELTARKGQEVTKQQVYRTIHDTRKKLSEILPELKNTGQTEKVKKVEEILAALPAKPFGGGGGGGKRGNSIDALIADLL